MGRVALPIGVLTVGLVLLLVDASESTTAIAVAVMVIVTAAALQVVDIGRM